MYACGRCHCAVRCQAGKHERIFFGNCQVCGQETTVMDCVGGEVVAKHRQTPAPFGIDIYRNVKTVDYRRKQK